MSLFFCTFIPWNALCERADELLTHPVRPCPQNALQPLYHLKFVQACVKIGDVSNA